MPLTPYRRHSADCPHAAKGMGWFKCKCPIWVYGQTEDGRTLRESLKTRDWTRAGRRVELLEKSPAAAVAEMISAAAPATGETVTLKSAISTYLADCRRLKFTEGTLDSYSRTLRFFSDWCHGIGIDDVRELHAGTFSGFLASRPNLTTRSQRKEIAQLRTFAAFAVTSGWIKENFAKTVRLPKDEEPETLPFDRSETGRLIAATGNLARNSYRQHVYRWDAETEARYARAIVLVLLYTGLRISDVVLLRRDKVNLTTGVLTLRTMKTGHKVTLRLHPDAVAALVALPSAAGHQHRFGRRTIEQDAYFFNSGLKDLKCEILFWRYTLRRVGATAEVTNVHPHRFRDTFAKELLVNGTPMHVVQRLLGHTSIRTTEKHYAAFVPEHQASLDRATATLNFSAAA